MRRNVRRVAASFAVLSLVLFSIFGSRVSTASDPNPTTTSSQPSAVDVDFTTTTLVTLHLKHASPVVAADALAGQAGVPTRVSVLWNPRANTAPPRDFDVEKQPFLLALTQLCDAYALNEPGRRQDDGWTLFSQVPPIRPGMPPPRLSRPNPPWAHSPVVVSGPFAVFALKATRTLDASAEALKNAEADRPPSPGNYNLSIAVCAEPCVTVLQRPFYPMFHTFVDDRGTSLAADATEDGTRPRIPAPENDPWIMLCGMKTPDPLATKIAKLDGVILLQVVTQFQTFDLADPGSGNKATVNLGAYRATLEGFASRSGVGEQTTLTVYRDQIDQAEWSNRATLLNDGSRIRAFDSTGHILDCYGRQHETTDDAITFHLRFGRRLDANRQPTVGLPVRLRWDLPLETGERAVAFSFADLPLPPIAAATTRP